MKETRSTNLDLRVKRKSGNPVITGYAAVFNRTSEDLGGFTEVIAPGAFREALRKSDTVALYNHDPNFLLGRKSAGTLKLQEDETGLHMEIYPSDTTAVRDLITNLAAGNVKGQSFAFTVSRDTWDQSGDISRRTINEVDELFDVGPVVYPAYNDTTVALRSLNNKKEKNMKTYSEIYNEIRNLKADDQRLYELQAEFDEVKPVGCPTYADDGRRAVDGWMNRATNDPPATRTATFDRNNRSGKSYRFGQFLADVRAASMPGGYVSPRLEEYRAASGLNEGVASEGGVLLAQEHSMELLGPNFETGLLLPYCKRLILSGNSIKLPVINETSRATGSRWGGNRTYWKPEAGQMTGVNPSFASMELTLHKLTNLQYVTDELLSDVGVMGQIIQDSARDEIRFETDRVIIEGSGSGEPLGILNSDCLITVDTEAGQAADTIVFENIVKMWARLWPRGHKTAVWLVNPAALQQLYQMSLTIGTGGSAVFLPGGGASSEPYATLFGRPLIPMEQCAALGDVGDLILCDLENAYVTASKAQGVEAAVSMHLRFDYGENAYRFVYRFDGQPILSSAITPFKGSDTIGPFVALAAR